MHAVKKLLNQIFNSSSTYENINPDLKEKSDL